MTLLCIPITADTPDAMLDDCRKAIAGGAEAVELRLDYLTPLDTAQVDPLVRAAVALGTPVIATCRIATEGGRYQGDEIQRTEIFEAAIRAGADLVDVELDAWNHSKLLRERVWAALDASTSQTRRLMAGCGHILSQHNFQETPPRFQPTLGAMLSTPVDILKGAYKANSILDSIRVLGALYEWRNVMPAIALSMGETGVLTRVLSRKLGAFLTFGSLEAGKESAPGQVTLADMKGLYRWDHIGPATRVYGVVGCPVAHSMSPAIHNAAFGATAHDGVYLPMRVEPAYEDFKAFLDAFLERAWLDLRGLSVTIPHKENLLRYVQEYRTEHGDDRAAIEPLAARIGVANTLQIEPLETVSGAPQRYRLSASNTDYAGALDALCTGMKIQRRDLKDMRVAVIGAGGASRAIVAGLRDCGAIVFIYNRTGSKARAIAADFGGIAMPWESREMIDMEVIINCTSIGMWPEIDATPLERAFIPPNSVVFDTVYNPIETRLLRDARQRGCLCIDGVAMFVNQAALQFQRWTGLEPPRDRMREVVLRKLSGT